MIRYECTGCGDETEAPEWLPEQVCPMCGTVNTLPADTADSALDDETQQPAGAPDQGPAGEAAAAGPPAGAAKRVNLGFAIIGATLGALLGAGIWCAIEYLLQMQYVYIALLCGLLSGGGAVLLGGGRSQAVGVVSAAAGTVSIVLGLYLSFQVYVHSDAARRQWEDALITESREFASLSPQERASIVSALLDRVRFRDVLTNVYGSDDLAWLVSCGVFGLVAGYAIAAKTPTASPYRGKLPSV